jgi:hypothetical protein
VTALGPGRAPSWCDWRHRLPERSGHHPAKFPPTVRIYTNRIEALRNDHGICECVDCLGWVRNDPFLVIRRQAVAVDHAQIIEQFADVHRPMVARSLVRGPGVRSCGRSHLLAVLVDVEFRVGSLQEVECATVEMPTQ